MKLRPEPEQSPESLNEFPTQMAETTPINSESQIAENKTTNEMSYIENTLNEDGALKLKTVLTPDIHRETHP